MKNDKTKMEEKREDVVYAFVRQDTDDDDSSISCLRLNIEHTAMRNNSHVVFGDESSGVFSPPPCFACVVDRSLVGKDEWDRYLKSIKTVGTEQKTVYIIVDGDGYSLPPKGSYISIPLKEDNGSIRKINDAIRRLKFLADCEAGRDNEHMPPGLGSVFAVTNDKKLRKELTCWAANNECRLVWGENKGFEIELGLFPMCCVFDRMAIADEDWKRYQDMPNISRMDEVDGIVVYSCVEIEDDFYDIPTDTEKNSPSSEIKKDAQPNIDRKEAFAAILRYLDEAKKYRDEILWPRMRNAYKEEGLELLK